MFALHPMQRGDTPLRKLTKFEKKEVAAGASIMRS
jgi:hypothetical protein